MTIYKLPDFKKELKKELKKNNFKLSLAKFKRREGREFKKRLKNWFVPALIFSVFLASFLGFFVAALSFNYFVSISQNPLEQSLDFSRFLPSPEEEEEEAGLPPQIISEETAIIKAVKQVSPAVVSIIVTKDLPIMEEYYYNPFEDLENIFGEDFGLRVPGYRQRGTERQEIGGGTGFIISSDGLILTNKHVVLDQEADYTVLTNEGEQFEASVLARDPIQDIAVLKIETEKSLPLVKLGDSDSLEIGQKVIAIGNVLGEFRNSVSMGIISGLGRNVIATGPGISEVLEGIIQTDAAINRGNSGGPLLNLKAEVIGMNTATALEAENVGFAIPINRAKRDIAQVKESGEIAYPFLGIYYALVTPAFQEEFNLGVDYGAWIGRDRLGEKTEIALFPGSAAEKAGLKQDDIILEFGGQKITLDNSLAKIIMDYGPGDIVVLKILRKGETKTISVILERRTE